MRATSRQSAPRCGQVDASHGCGAGSARVRVSDVLASGAARRAGARRTIRAEDAGRERARENGVPHVQGVTRAIARAAQGRAEGFGVGAGAAAGGEIGGEAGMAKSLLNPDEIAAMVKAGLQRLAVCSEAKVSVEQVTDPDADSNWRVNVFTESGASLPRGCNAEAIALQVQLGRTFDAIWPIEA